MNSYRTLDEFPGYRFCEDGTVWTSLSNNEPDENTYLDDGEYWFTLKERVDRNGYLEVTVGGRKIDIQILIASAFHGLKPFPGAQVRHLDGNQKNNNASNLKWGTVLENRTDQTIHGTEAIGEKHGNSHIKNEDVIKIKELIAEGKSQSEVARMFDTTQPHISRILSGERRRKK